MKKIFLFSAILATVTAHAQSTYAVPWQDISTFTNSSAFQHGGSQVIVDAATGNVFTVGTFENSISIGSFNLNSSGSRDIYVAKYDASGGCTKAIRLGSAGFDDGYSITYRDNYVFVSGIVAGNGTIYKLDDDASPLDVIITQDLGADVRPRSLYAYGLTGLVLVGGSFIEECYLPTGGATIDLVASNSGTGFFDSWTGIFDMDIEFTDAGVPNSSTGDNEIMCIWGRNGYIYCTGYFMDDLKWAAGGTTLTADAHQDMFMASVQVTTSINIINYVNDIIQAGSTEYVPPPGGAFNDAGWRECGYGICANGTAIYVTGMLNNGTTPEFDGTAYTGCGAFVARVNYSGSQMGALSWVRTAEICGSSSGTLNSIGYGIAVDGTGNVFATGRGDEDMELDGGGNADICVWTGNGIAGFIAKYEADGDILSADAVNQHSYHSTWTEGRSICVNACEVFTTGWCQSSETFQAGNLAPENVGASKCAMYILEIGRDATISDDVVYCEACASFPNTINLAVSGGSTYSWSPGTYLSSTSSATPTYSLTSCGNSGTTNYTVTITGAGGGCTTTATVSVTAGSTAAANAGVDFGVCAGSSYPLGTTAIGGLTYSWSPTTNLTGANTAQPDYYNTVQLSSPRTYTVTVTDVCGSTATDQVTLTNTPIGMCRVANPALSTSEVFPNPSTGMFFVNLPLYEEDTDVEFVVTDLAGRVVRQSTVTTSGGIQTVDLSGEATGVYMLSVTRNGLTEVYKLIVE